MQKLRTCLRPAIRPGAVIFLALLCYLAPLRVVGAFLLAMSVHELGHLGAIALCGGRLHGLSLEGRGAVIRVEGLGWTQEMLCALAGPCAGLLLLALGRCLPVTASLALCHSLYNLLPIYPLDGGRALYCALIPLGERAWTWTRMAGLAMAGLLAFLGIYLSLACHMGLAPLAAGIGFALRAASLWWKK